MSVCLSSGITALLLQNSLRVREGAKGHRQASCNVMTFLMANKYYTATADWCGTKIGLISVIECEYLAILLPYRLNT